ncbi:MAG: orotidine 5'-phosphate decarboxylase [Candidatus Brockarchaeota archaeon]|nr:orotidine 5'-phosphate decarboxylase [Candidatus Brockarchaeota archaeon]
MKRQYARWIRELKERKKTPIVLSLDPPSGARRPFRALGKVLRETHPYICAVKVGRQLTAEAGFSKELLGLVEYAHCKDLPVICDSKLNDVAHTNLVVVKKHLRFGMDAEIVSPLPGWEGGLDAVFRESKKKGKGVLVLGYMSHPGARDTFELDLLRPRMKLYEHFAKKAEAWGADGAVVPATRPSIVRRFSSLTGVPLYAVGIGAQGGGAREATLAGADYLIVGRAITCSRDPGSAAERVAAEAAGSSMSV